MEININNTARNVYVWLTKAESAAGTLPQSLKYKFTEWRAQKYTVAVFRSGTHSLEDNTDDLIITHYKRMTSGLRNT